MSLRKATDEEIIIAFGRSGSMRSVRDDLGVARRTVRACLDRAGITYRPRYVNSSVVKQIISIYKEADSMQEVVRRTGVSQATVRKYLVAAGFAEAVISKRGRHAGDTSPITIMVPDKELARLYQEHQSTGEIARMLGCSAAGVAVRLHKAGVKLLPKGGNTRFKRGQPSPRRIAFDEKELIQLYQKLGSTHRVAGALGCSQTSVRGALGRIGSLARRKSVQGYAQYEPYPEDWTEALKNTIRQRDGFECRLCGKSQKKNGSLLCVHHIDYDKENLGPKNLISLCRRCHAKTNGNRKHWQQYFCQMLRKKRAG